MSGNDNKVITFDRFYAISFLKSILSEYETEHKFEKPVKTSMTKLATEVHDYLKKGNPLTDTHEKFTGKTISNEKYNIILNKEDLKVLMTVVRRIRRISVPILFKDNLRHQVQHILTNLK